MRHSHPRNTLLQSDIFTEETHPGGRCPHKNIYMHMHTPFPASPRQTFLMDPAVSLASLPSLSGLKSQARSGYIYKSD